jgi:hypothetical protein
MAAQISAIGVGRHPAEEPGSLAFESLADLIPLVNIGSGREPHAGSDARLCFDDSLVLEALQSFRYRQDAHAEFSGETAAGKFSADRYSTLQDSAKNDLISARG